MTPAFTRFAPDEAEELARFLTSENWPFHSSVPDRATVLGQVGAGRWNSASARTFWVDDGGARLGVLRMFDLDDGTPLFDLRIRAAQRGRGLGAAAVAWLTRYLFDLLPGINRVEATTRVDNVAMRTVLRRRGYVQEAHYRQAWPDPDGGLHDCAGYAILRRDWETGTLTPVRWTD